MKPNTRTVLSTDKLTVKKKKHDPNPLAGTTVFGDGIEAHNPPTADPYAGMTDSQKTNCLLESLLYYAQNPTQDTYSPRSKGVYFLLAYSPLSWFGFHKFFVGKCLQGIIISIISTLLAAVSGGVLLGISAFVMLIWVLVETYRDWSQKAPISDYLGRPLK